MTPATDWNNRWFGVWRETGATYSACPSVQDFMDSAALAEFDKGRLVRYLETAHVVASTSRLAFPCVLCGARHGGSLSYRTDGEWLWPDDLGHYVSEHNVAPPRAMLEHVAGHRYDPSAVSQEQVERLQWPDCAG
jgi:hypothetical protein